MKKLHIVSLGCNKNLVDTEVMMGRLREYELTSDPEEADVLIVNTCGFIDAAKEESLNTVIDLDSQRKEGSKLVMAGCLSERYKEELQKELSEVDLFTGVGDYNKIDQLLRDGESRFSEDVFLLGTEERVITGSNYHAYIKIAEGCNQSCSFCAIPGFKGKLHSRGYLEIVTEIKGLVKQGYYDFSFIAQDTSSYLRDEGIADGLIGLVNTVGTIEGVRSARIMYLYPSTLSPEAIDAIAASPVFANYFDIPVQHISDRMLKIMKRGLGRDATKALIEKMRAVPGSYVRTAVIVGHPGETEEDFAELCDYLKEGLFDMISVFAYSDEEGTRSYEMEEKVPEEVVSERLRIVGEIIDENLKARLEAMVGRTVPVEINGESDETELLLSAKHRDWAPEIDPEILVNESEAGELAPGDRCQAEILQAVGDKLLAKIISKE